MTETSRDLGKRAPCFNKHGSVQVTQSAWSHLHTPGEAGRPPEPRAEASCREPPSSWGREEERGGLRLSEALALKPKDLDSEAGTVTVLHGKGDRRRTVGLDPGAMAIVMRWIDKRKQLGIDGRAPLFCTLTTQPLKRSYVRTLLPRLANKTGIDKRVHPHGLRHTHAYELMMEGLPVPIIQQQLGHASLATTDRYLRHIAPRDVVLTMQAREWVP